MAFYPNPTEIREGIERSCAHNLNAKPVVAFLRHRMTWNGTGFDIVADAVVLWKRGDEVGWHGSVDIRASDRNGLSVGLTGGHYGAADFDEANKAALARAESYGCANVRLHWDAFFGNPPTEA